MQEAFYRVIKDREKFINHEKQYAWLVKTCEHIALNAIKRRAVRNKYVLYNSQEMSQIEDIGAKVDAWLDGEPSSETIAKIYNMLTETEKDIYDDVFVCNMSTAQSAKKRNKAERSGALSREEKYHKLKAAIDSEVAKPLSEIEEDYLIACQDCETTKCGDDNNLCSYLRQL